MIMFQRWWEWILYFGSSLLLVFIVRVSDLWITPLWNVFFPPPPPSPPPPIIELASLPVPSAPMAEEEQIEGKENTEVTKSNNDLVDIKEREVFPIRQEVDVVFPSLIQKRTLLPSIKEEQGSNTTLVTE